MKWIKYKDQCPDKGTSIWVSNGEDVFAVEAGYAYYFGEKPITHWALREIPTLPKREFHNCKKVSSGGLNWIFTCYEHPTRGLMICYNSDQEVECSFCPFCGFTLEKI